MSDFNYIGLDLGTGAIKGVCWHPVKGVLRKSSKRVTFSYPRPGFVEIDALEYEALILNMLHELASAEATPIGGIAMAAASGNTMLCDKEATPLTPIISWLDTRLDWKPPTEWNVRQVTGWPAIPQFPLMHLEHLRRECPSLLHSSHVAMNNDWLSWRLSGKHALDYSNATPFYLCNQRTKKYEQTFLNYYGIDTEHLPELLAPGALIGTLRPKYEDAQLNSGTHIVAGSFDHPAGARAVGVTKPGELLISCGTSWVGFYPCARYEDVPMNALCDSFESHHGGCWGAMFSVSKIGIRVETFIVERYGEKEERYELFNEEALHSGTEANVLAMEVIGSFKQKMQNYPQKYNRIVLSGGPSEGKAWPILLEQALHLQIEPSPYSSYTGAVGAAKMAML